jgi:hypothetical protein
LCKKKNNYSHLAKTKLIILILIGSEHCGMRSRTGLVMLKGFFFFFLVIDVEGFGCELITTMLYGVGSGTILEFNYLCLLLE